MPDDSIITKVTKNLKDGDGNVRLKAAQKMDDLGSKAEASVPALIEALQDSSGPVRSAAASALRSIGPAAKGAADALIKATKDPAARDMAILALLKIGAASAEAIPLVADWLTTSEMAKTQPGHAQALSNFGAAAIPTLIDFVLHQTGRLRVAAVHALIALGPAASSAVPALISATPGETRPMLCAIALALGKIDADPDAAIPVLLKLLAAGDHEVERQAIETIGTFGSAGVPAVPRLTQMLDETNKLWYFALQALENIGPGAKAALPAIQKLLNSKKKAVKDVAELAIGRIAATPMSKELDTKLTPLADATTIDFARTKEAVANMIGEGIAKFAKEHPDVEVCCIGVFGYSYGADASLCLDTPENSAKLIKNSSSSVGHDRLGVFSTAVYDFAYVEYSSTHFKWWPSLYDVGSDFKIKMPDGRTVRRSVDKIGDEAINIPFGKLLREVLQEAWPITGLKLSKPFRLGVKIHDSEYVEFWVPK